MLKNTGTTRIMTENFRKFTEDCAVHDFAVVDVSIPRFDIHSKFLGTPQLERQSDEVVIALKRVPK